MAVQKLHKLVIQSDNKWPNILIIKKERTYTCVLMYDSKVGPIIALIVEVFTSCIVFKRRTHILEYHI